KPGGPARTAREHPGGTCVGAFSAEAGSGICGAAGAAHGGEGGPDPDAGWSEREPTPAGNRSDVSIGGRELWRAGGGNHPDRVPGRWYGGFDSDTPSRRKVDRAGPGGRGCTEHAAF